MKDFSNMPLCLSFDDVMITPRHSTIKSRSEPNTKTKIGTISVDIPIISSPMDTVTESAMALAMATAGGMGIIHRFMEPAKQANMLGATLTRVDETFLHGDSIYNSYGKIGVAIGTGESELERFRIILDKCGRDRVVTVAIDVANGFSSYMKEMIERVRDLGGERINIIAGNVATGDGYNYLSNAGANAVRVGLGGGSICKTRIQTGIGIPTLSSVMDCSRWRGANMKSASIIADGGIRYPGDLAKSIAAGSDAIMVGRIIAASYEAPGDIEDGYKVYRGMASEEVQIEKRGGLKPDTCAEGVSTRLKVTGSVSKVLEEFRGGLVSSMTYVDARNLEEFRLNTSFVRITTAGMDESHAFGTKR